MGRWFDRPSAQSFLGPLHFLLAFPTVLEYNYIIGKAIKPSQGFKGQKTMAKEMVKHNLLNFPALKELPNLEYKTAEASKTTKDKAGKETETKWSFEYPVFTADHVSEIVRILGPENLAAILTDEAKTIYRTAPSQEKLTNDAIQALVRAGIPENVARDMVSAASK